MHGRRNPFVAVEGIPILLVLATAGILLLRYSEARFAAIPALLFFVAWLIFRDPRRKGPSVALGVVSPVDGQVVAVERIEDGEFGSPAYRVRIRVNALGTYTARSPVEGKIMEPRERALWVQTDEGDDVLLRFSGYRFGLPPHAIARYGERLGQGQRCAYLRLTRFAEVEFPAAGKTAVEVGAAVIAGKDLIGSVPVPR